MTDQPTLYVTTTGECSLFVDGESVPLGDPARPGAYTISMTAAVWQLARMAGVTVVKDVDRRALVYDDPDAGTRRRDRQADVEARLAELARAAELRDAGYKALRDAERIENAR